MKLYRVATGAGPRWARQEDTTLELLDGDPWAGLGDTAERIDLGQATLLAPARPSKIVGVGLNYRDHAAERGREIPEEPLLFLKPPSALLAPGRPIPLPPGAGRIDHEAELGLVIGRRARRLGSREEADEHILGAVCLNDVTARELQARDGQFTRAKGFDGFCPVGPCIAPGLALGRLAVTCRVNGELRQSGSTEDLIFDPAYLVWFVSQVMTLEPGDIIATGTPAGIGPLAPGDEVEVEIEGVGVLRNSVALESEE